MNIKFYLWVVPVPDPRFVRYGYGYYLPLADNTWIFKIKSNPYLAQQKTGHNPRLKRPSPIR
jgi:hypothetical protein